MSDAEARDSVIGVGDTAGSLLRRARKAQGMEIEGLASLMKVTPRKLELLESNRFEDLPDATFARALAQSVCRTLRIDPAPVLALLPQASGMKLEQLNQGLNMPFRDRSSGVAPADWSMLGKPVVWGPALIVLAAIALYLWPAALVDKPAPTPRSATTTVTVPADSASAPAPLPKPTVETVYSAPPAPESASSAPAVAMVSGLMQLRTSAQSWVEVLDARGQSLLSRVIQPGEVVGLDGALPLRVKIGNAAGTQLMFRGEVVELASFTVGNVARLELK